MENIVIIASGHSREIQALQTTILSNAGNFCMDLIWRVKYNILPCQLSAADGTIALATVVNEIQEEF